MRAQSAELLHGPEHYEAQAVLRSQILLGSPVASFPEPAVGSGARLSLTPSGSPQLGDIHTSEKPKVKKRGNSAPIYWQTMKQSADGKMDSEEIVLGISMRTGGTVTPVVK